MQNQDDVVIDYTNHRGERSKRWIRPIGIMFGASEWHPTQQWILRAYDHGKAAMRSFAIKDIHSWRPVGEGD